MTGTEEKPALADRLRAAQLRDVEEMAAIIQKATTNGGDAPGACRTVLGGAFQLTKTVTEGIRRKAGEHGKN